MVTDNDNWWGGFEVEGHGCIRWRIGPLHLLASRGEQEWRISWWRETSPLDTALSVEHGSGEAEPDKTEVARFGFRRPPTALRLQPLLADRSIVVRPDTPFYIASGDEITFYISTPLWLQLYCGNRESPLMEIPVYRPSDTWMGPNTLEGELCYDSTTSAKLRLDELVRRPHRAVSPVVIRNHGGDALRVEKLNVPVRYLPLLVDERGTFWTRPVLLSRDSSGHMGSVDIGSERLVSAVRTSLVKEARDEYEESAMRRVFARWVG